LLVAREDLLVRIGQPLRVALQRVVDRLRDVEELLLRADDPPFDFEAGALHQRDQRVVDLGDAAAERGCGHVRDPLALERLGETPDLVHQAARRQRRVVGERLVPDVDELQHRRPRVGERRPGGGGYPAA
jgi:hypothetical protein